MSTPDSETENTCPESAHLEHLIHQLEQEILHTEPTPHNPSYFSEIAQQLHNLRLKRN